jgi:hypothetical protein
MNKVLRNAVASVAFLGMGVGALSACGNNPGYPDTQYVYVHGYYDSYHHYHSYTHGKRVTVSYYNHHKSSYPKPYKTTTGKVKPKATHKSAVNKAPKLGSKKTSSSTKKSGGYSYKKRR